MLASLLARIGSALDRRFGWSRLPKPIGILTLVGLRIVLRRENLYDTSVPGTLAQPPAGGPPADTSFRTLDGTYNDLAQPRMGALGARFGMPLPKGAGPPVLAAGRAFVARHGADALGQVAKLHFRTTRQVTGAGP